jgi:aromatic ring hydroxylase
MPTRITSMKELKAEAEQGAEFFILINHGLRSSKDIVWDAQRRKFHVFNHIDQTEQQLAERQLMDERLTNIGYAMKNGALFKHDF